MTISIAGALAGMGRLYMGQLRTFERCVTPELANKWRMLVCDAMDAATAARATEREARGMTLNDVATNWDLWRQLVDPAGAITKSPAVWYAMPLARRVELAQQALQQ